jgi:hypothetical protein
MDKEINITLENYLKLIRQKYSGINKAFIFGSYAKGNSNQDSDIDLERFDIQVQLMLMASQIDSRIEPHPISFSDFNSGNPFPEEIRKTGIEIQT